MKKLASVGLLIWFLPIPSMASCYGTVTEPKTVLELVGPAFDKILQSYEVQVEFSKRVSDLEKRGYQEHANLIRQFGLLNNRAQDYKVTFENLIKQQNIILAENLRLAQLSGDIPEGSDASIKVAVLFHKIDGFDRNNPDHWISLEPHETIPMGYKIFEESNFPPGAALWSALGRGHFPVNFRHGIFHTEMTNRFSPQALAHELEGHMITYFMNPDYALAYKKVSQKIIEMHKKLSQEKGKPYWSFIYKTGLFSRIYIFNEGLTQSSPQVIQYYSKLFGLPPNSEIPSTQFNIEDLKPQTNQLSVLNSMLDDLVTLTPELSRPIGGATLVSTVKNSALSNFAEYLANPMYKAIKSWQKAATSQEQVELLKTFIALIRGYHFSMSQLDINELAEEIFQSQPTKGSPMSHFFSENSGFYKSYQQIILKIEIHFQPVFHGNDSHFLRFSSEFWDSPIAKGYTRAN